MAIGAIGQVFARALGGVPHAFVARPLQRGDIVGREHRGAPGPERVDERQTGHAGPRFAEIDLLDLCDVRLKPDATIILRRVRL